MRLRLCRLVLALGLISIARPSQARNMDPSRFYLTLALGPGIRMPTPLGASPAALMLTGQGEYSFNRRYSAVTGLTVGAGGTVPVLGHLGAKARLHDLGLALSPYAQAQLGVGGLIDVMGANLTWVGGRLGLGADYFITRRTLTGVALLFDLGGTTGERPAFYGLVSLVLTASFSPHKSMRT